MKKEVMKIAWRIKKQNKKYIFGECLKMAWNLVKSMNYIKECILKNETHLENFSDDYKREIALNLTNDTERMMNENRDIFNYSEWLNLSDCISYLFRIVNKRHKVKFLGDYMIKLHNRINYILKNI